MKIIIDDNYFCKAEEVGQAKYINNKDLVMFFKNNDSTVYFRDVRVEIIDALSDFFNNEEAEFDIRKYKFTPDELKERDSI